MQEKNQNEIRAKLEEITAEIVSVSDELDLIERQIEKLPIKKIYQLKWLSNEKLRIKTRLNWLHGERSRLINLLNIIS